MSIARRMSLIVVLGAVGVAMMAPTTVVAAGRFVDDDGSRFAGASSILRNNTGDGFKTHPGIFFLGDSISFTNAIVE